MDDKGSGLKFREVKKYLDEVVFEVARPFIELENLVDGKGEQNLKSFNEATKAYRAALRSNGDKNLKAEAFKTFAACYSDLRMDKKSTEMNQKWLELANKAIEP